MSKERSILLSKTVLAAMVAVALALGATQAVAGTREETMCNTTFPGRGACIDVQQCQEACDMYDPGVYGGVCANGCCTCKTL